MPIIIPETLPASEILRQENVFVMNEERAVHQDIRPLEILILNLMPEKEITETQLIRLLANTPLQVKVTLMRTATHHSKNTTQCHLDSFYTTFDQIQNRKYDGMIITGAPVEHMAFESVNYWSELKSIMDFGRTNVTSTIYLCWGAQAGLYHHYQIPKYKIRKKIFGIFKHQVMSPNHILFRGFDTNFNMPHSRYTLTRQKDIEMHPDLELLSHSEEAGVSIVVSKDLKHVFISGHPEYNQETLAGEYFRDLNKGMATNMPKNYFKNDDAKNAVDMTWRAHAHLLFSNWINYCVYQRTPYELF